MDKEEEFMDAIVKEEISKVENEESKGFNGKESKARKVVRKVVVSLIALFLVFLLFSYLVPGSHTLSILEGLLVSSKLNEDFTVDLANGEKVVFDSYVYNVLRRMYFDNPRTEFKVCLEGNKEGTNYIISELKVPRTFLQTFSSVRSEQCSEKTIVPLHTHPYKSCVFSEQDLKSYESFKRTNPDAIIGLMCEVERFTFYGFE